MKAVMSEKGQVTIPKRLRDRLGIRPGQVLDFEEEDGGLVVVKCDLPDPITEMRGAFTSHMTSDEWIEELRGPVDLP